MLIAERAQTTAFEDHCSATTIAHHFNLPPSLHVFVNLCDRVSSVFKRRAGNV
jgi:hypothetical protein